MKTSSEMLRTLCFALVLSGTLAQYGPPKQVGPIKHRTTTTTQVPPPASNEILPSTYVESGSLPGGGTYDIKTSVIDEPGFKGQSTTFTSSGPGALPTTVNIAKNPFLMAALSGMGLPTHPGVMSHGGSFVKPGSQVPSPGLQNNPFISGSLQPQQKPGFPQQPQVSGCGVQPSQAVGRPPCPTYPSSGPGLSSQQPQSSQSEYPGQQPQQPGFPNEQPQQPGYTGQQPEQPGFTGQQPESNQPDFPDQQSQQPGFPNKQQPGSVGVSTPCCKQPPNQQGGGGYGIPRPQHSGVQPSQPGFTGPSSFPKPQQNPQQPGFNGPNQTYQPGSIPQGSQQPEYNGPNQPNQPGSFPNPQHGSDQPGFSGPKQPQQQPGFSGPQQQQPGFSGPKQPQQQPEQPTQHGYGQPALEPQSPRPGFTNPQQPSQPSPFPPRPTTQQSSYGNPQYPQQPQQSGFPKPESQRPPSQPGSQLPDYNEPSPFPSRPTSPQPSYGNPQNPQQPPQGGFLKPPQQQPSGQLFPQTGGQGAPNSKNPFLSGSIPSGSQVGPICSGANQYCVPVQACQNGLFDQQGNYYRKERCSSGEVCCKAKQPSYGGPTEAPITKYTGPLNTTPPPGCAAALKCVPDIYCDVEGVMRDSPVSLTREQYELRVPLSDCQNMDTGVIGKCCRDPNYKDPWPAGMMMNKAPGDFDDGSYRPGKYPGEGGSPGNIPEVTANSAQPPSGYSSNPVQPQPQGTPYASRPNQQPQSTPTISPPNPYTIKKPLGVFGGNVTPYPVAPKTGQTHSEVFPNNEDKPYGGEFLPQPETDDKVTYPSGQNTQPNNPSGGHSLPKPDNSQPPFTQPFNPPNPTTSQQPTYGQPKPTYGQPQPSQQSPEQNQPSFEQLPPFSQPSQPQRPSPNVADGSSVPVTPGQECGVRRPASSASPDETGFGEFPWQATIVSAYNNSATCSGAIIAPNAVITAAHCIQGSRPEELFVRVGSWRLGQDSPKPSQTRTAAATAVHPVYNEGSLVKDQAIIVMNESFDFDEHVDRICLPSNSLSGQYTPKTSNCFITGWGRPTLQNNVPGSVLHKVPVKIIQKPECENSLKQTLGKYFILNDGFTCAAPISDAELCKVDSGSPLVCDRGDGHYELVGVYSWDTKCTSSAPGVTAGCDVEWINKVLASPVDKLREEQNAQVSVYSSPEDVDEKPGFALGYGK